MLSHTAHKYWETWGTKWTAQYEPTDVVGDVEGLRIDHDLEPTLLRLNIPLEEVGESLVIYV